MSKLSGLSRLADTAAAQGFADSWREQLRDLSITIHLDNTRSLAEGTWIDET